MQNTKQETTRERSTMPKFIIPSDIFYEHNEVTPQCAIIYSYMLARYNMFSKQRKVYYEGISSISRNCYCGTTAAKHALKILEGAGLLIRETCKGTVGSRNKYAIIDRYDISGARIEKEHVPKIKELSTQPEDCLMEIDEPF